MAVSANRLELLQIADAVAREKSIERTIVVAPLPNRKRNFRSSVERSIVPVSEPVPVVADSATVMAGVIDPTAPVAVSADSVTEDAGVRVPTEPVAVSAVRPMSAQCEPAATPSSAAAAHFAPRPTFARATARTSAQAATPKRGTPMIYG